MNTEDSSHLRVRPNGVIYTTAEELMSDPEVREDSRGTCEVLRRSIEGTPTPTPDYEIAREYDDLPSLPGLDPRHPNG